MWVKICANTNLDDALLASELGADAVGFVFAPSTRRVTPEQVAPFTAALPSTVETIGVFYTMDFDEIAAGAKTAGLTGVQLHQAFEPELVRRLKDLGLTVIQTMHWDTSLPASEQVEAFLNTSRRVDEQGLADWLLVDSRTPKAMGGTGVAFDWSAASAALKTVKTPLLIAGGLHPGNVGEAILKLRPAGVDVATGVEASAGKKDLTRLREFIAKARTAGA